MANPFDRFDAPKIVRPDTSQTGNPFDKFDRPSAVSALSQIRRPEQPAQRDRTWGEVVTDTAGDAVRGLAQGALNLGGGVAQTANMVTGGALDRYIVRPAQNLVDRALGGTGDNARGLAGGIGVGNEMLQEGLSDPLKRDLQEVQAAEGFLGAVGAVIQRPRVLGQFLAEQVPMIGTLGVGAAGTAARAGQQALARGATQEAATAAATKAAERGLVGANAALSGGFASQEAQQTALEQPDAVWDQNPEFVALAAEVGREQAKQQLATRAGMTAGAIAAPLGALGAKITAPFERQVFTGALKAGGARGIAAAAGKEAAEEMVQEGGEQFGANVGVRTHVDPQQDLFGGVPEAMGIGGTVGGLLGGGMYAGGRVAQRRGQSRAAPAIAQKAQEAAAAMPQGGPPPGPMESAAQAAAADAAADPVTAAKASLAERMQRQRDAGLLTPTTRMRILNDVAREYGVQPEQIQERYPDAAPGSIAAAANAVPARPAQEVPPEQGAPPGNYPESPDGSFSDAAAANPQGILTSSTAQPDNPAAPLSSTETESNLSGAASTTPPAAALPEGAQAAQETLARSQAHVPPPPDVSWFNAQTGEWREPSDDEIKAELHRHFEASRAPGAAKMLSNNHLAHRWSINRERLDALRAEVVAERKAARTKPAAAPAASATPVTPPQGGERAAVPEPLPEVTNGPETSTGPAADRPAMAGGPAGGAVAAAADPVAGEPAVAAESGVAPVPATGTGPAVPPVTGPVEPVAASVAAPRIEPLGEKGLLVHGDVAQTRERLAAAGFTRRGRVHPSGALQFDRKHQAAIEKALAPQEQPAAEQAPAGVGAPVVDQAAQQSASSPANARPEPTDAQREAGNYAMGHVRLNGMDVSIETPAGSRRRPEHQPLKNHYGYIRGTKGRDKDHVDVFLGPRADDPTAPVFVVDQNSRDGAFDEHKVMMGFADEAEARAAYLSNYPADWNGLGAITRMEPDAFKAWVRDEKATAKPAAARKPSDRRTNAEDRARIDALPADERDAEITRLRAEVDELRRAQNTNPVTGLPNKAAFDADESLGWPTVAAIDMDGLKRLNDHVGHEAADVVLRRLGALLQGHSNEGARFYHRSGDEFAARFRDESQAQAMMDALQRDLEQEVVRITAADGTDYDYHGIGISYGTGASYEQADGAANRNKADRLAAGVREEARADGPPRRLRAVPVQEGREGDGAGPESRRPGLPEEGLAAAPADAAAEPEPLFRMTGSVDPAGTDQQLQRQFDQVEQAINDATDAFGPNQPIVYVIRSPEDLPNWIKREDPRYKRASGVRVGRSVWIITDRLPRANAVQVALKKLAHEAVGHYGIDNIIDQYLDVAPGARAGDAGWQRLTADIVAWRKNPNLHPAVRKIMEQVQRNYSTADTPVSDGEFAREVVAHMAEEGLRNGIMGRIVAAVRRFLRQYLPNLRVTDSEIRAMLAEAETWLRQPAPVRGGRPAGAMAFSVDRRQNGRVATDESVAGEQGGRAAGDESRRDAAIDETTGLPLNDDGTVTVYHHTSAKSAAQIRQTGRLRSAGEPDVYVTTRAETDTGYGDTAVAIRVDPARLEIDDEFPDGRRDFRMRVGRPGGSMQVDVENDFTAPDSDGAMFSAEQKSFAEQVRERLAAKDRRGAMLDMGRTPAVLRMLGFPDLPLQMPSGVLFKLATGKQGERAALTERQIAKLPELIDGPAAVLRSATDPDSVVVAIDEKDSTGAPIVVAVAMDRAAPGNPVLRVNVLTSAYGKADASWFQREAAAGRALYADQEKALGRQVGSGAALHGSTEQGGQGPGPILRSPADLRNFRAKQRSALANERATFSADDSARAAQTKTPEFRRWFGDSKVVDENGKPLVVYRGEHGEDDGRQFQTRSTLTFTEDPEVASIYATEPNDYLDDPVAPRVTPAYLRIERPLFQSSDPFLELGVIADAFGQDEAVRVARKFSDSIEGTGNWQENLSSEFRSVDQMMDAAPERVRELYFDAYRYLDDVEEVARAVAAGFDGAIHIGNGESAGSYEYRVFDERSVKSAIGNRGTFDPTDPNINFSADAEPFYSALVESVQNARGAPRQGTAQAWKQWLDGAQRRGEFRQAERDWLGVDAWLDGQAGPITRDALAEFVRAHQVQVQDITLTEGDGQTARERFETPSQSLTLPGGQNYRELLLTMPTNDDAKLAEANRLHQLAGVAGTPGADSARYIEERDRLRAEAGNPQAFKSSHYDQPNILAHVRFNERTDADGKRVLFIEEIQSDFGQSMRKSKLEIVRQVKSDFDGIVNRMKAAGVLTVECD